MNETGFTRPKRHAVLSFTGTIINIDQVIFTVLKFRFFM